MSKRTDLKQLCDKLCEQEHQYLNPTVISKSQVNLTYFLPIHFRSLICLPNFTKRNLDPLRKSKKQNQVKPSQNSQRPNPRRSKWLKSKRQSKASQRTKRGTTTILGRRIRPYPKTITTCLTTRRKPTFLTLPKTESASSKPLRMKSHPKKKLRLPPQRRRTSISSQTRSRTRLK